jgi:microcystin-dependent protein
METLLGQIALLPYPYTPEGWHPCDGSSLSIMENQALYSVLRDQFGGDGTRTFNLPNLPPVQVGDVTVRYFIALQGMYPVRA